jgi:ABC-type nickel/cobalt efflux system permease component RcnA
VALGLIVTTTHVTSVVILGVVALWASSQVVPELLAPWLSLVSGALVLALGTWMVAIRLHPHPHPHGHADAPAQEGTSDQVRWAQLLVLGISGGMVPCVSATVVLLFAVYLGKILLGLVLILAFSLGLSATLIVLGVLVVRGRRWLERWSSGRRGRWVLAALPLASAAAVTILGALMTLVAAWAL